MPFHMPEGFAAKNGTSALRETLAQTQPPLLPVSH
jgi:hypothetical protein